MFEAAVVPLSVFKWLFYFYFWIDIYVHVSMAMVDIQYYTDKMFFSAFSEMLKRNVLPNNYLCIKLFIRILIFQLNSAILWHTQLSSYL